MFSHFLWIFILYPPTGSLPVHRNGRLFGEEPQLIPWSLFLLFVNQDQNMYYFDRMYQCMYWKICWFSSTTPWSVRGGPFPRLESRQRRVLMMETPAIQVHNLPTGISLCSSWPTLWSLSGGSSPLWELKQRQGPMIKISAIQVEDLHIGRSFWSNLTNFWPVRSGSSSLSSPTQRLEPTIESLGHSGEGWFEDKSKKVARNYKNASFDHVDLTDPYSHGELYSHGANQGQKKKKKKKKGLCSDIQTKHGCFFFCTFQMPRGHRGDFPRLAPGWTCQSLPIGMCKPGPYGRDENILTARAKQGKKKKKKKKTLFWHTDHAWLYIYRFFFCTFTMQRGLRQHWPRLPPGQTCWLLAIGMFESGPYGRDLKCTPRGLVGNHKDWIMSFHHDKISTSQTLIFPTCSSRVCIGPLPLQAFLCFFPCFFLAQFGARRTCRLVPIGMFYLGPTQAEAKKKKQENAKIRPQYPRGQRPLYPAKCRINHPNVMNTQAQATRPRQSNTKKRAWLTRFNTRNSRFNAIGTGVAKPNQLRPLPVRGRVNSTFSISNLKESKRVLRNVCNTRFKAYSNLKDPKRALQNVCNTRFEGYSNLKDEKRALQNVCNAWYVTFIL